MKKIVTAFFALDSQLYNKLTESERKKYATKLIAIIISILTSSIIAFEITYKIVGEVNWIMIPAVLIWISLIAMMDILLFRGGVNPFFRLIFSLALIAVTVTTTFTLISRDDIQQDLEQKSSIEVAQLDSIYNSEKNDRYASLKQKQENQSEYHQSVCIPEAKIGFPGPKYKKKHDGFCVPELLAISEMKAELDSVEIAYCQTYMEKREKAKAIVNPGFFEEFSMVITYIFADAMKITMFIIMALLLLCIESIAFFVSIKKDETSYKILEKKSVEANCDINQYLLQVEKDRKISETEMKVQRNSRFEKIHGKMEDYKLLSFIRTNFNKVKKAEPDMFMPEMGNSIEMYLSNESALIQKEIEDFFNELSDYKDTTKSPVFESTREGKINTPHSTCYYNTFFATMPMKELADTLWSESNGNPFNFCRKVFDWTKHNIDYQKTHGLDHYKTAREVFSTKSGICGEMSIFVNSLLKYKGLTPDYVHVDVDMNGKKVNHACSGIKIKGSYYLLDVPYNQFDAKHQRWNIVTDDDLILNMTEWNR